MSIEHRRVKKESARTVRILGFAFLVDTYAASRIYSWQIMQNSVLEGISARIENAATLEEAKMLGLALIQIIKTSHEGPCPGCALDHRAELERRRSQASRWVRRQT